jgi:hypothetical protein
MGILPASVVIICKIMMTPLHPDMPPSLGCNFAKQGCERTLA